MLDLDKIRKRYKIKEICYNFYKMEWKHTHITKEIELEALRDYYLNSQVNRNINYSFNDYIYDNGYFGMCCVCFEEFCKNEFLEEEYMKALLKEDKLIKMYLEYK